MEKYVIKQAEFNPRIKSYILFVITLFLLFTVIGIPILIFWVLGMGQYFSKRYYEHLQCKLTERHLEFKKGVLFKVEKTIPLENIQDLTFIENPLLKFFDLRVLKMGLSNGIREYREWIYQLLSPKELIKKKKRYYTPLEIVHLEEDGVIFPID